jgi:uncharacterized membrane protein YeaQ/YmgE (transglycosylase-associated protein family)
MLLLAIVLIGPFAGWVAHVVVGAPGRPDWGQITPLGISGSFVGGLLASILMGDGLAIRPSGLIGSCIGAIVLTAGVMHFWPRVGTQQRQHQHR